MSPIGRIFIVLNLILSAAFLAWASSSLATADNWKTKYSDLETEKNDAIANLETELSDLTVSKNESEEAARQRREERDQLQADSDRLSGEIEALKREKEKLSGDLTSMRSSLGDIDETVSSVSQAKDRAVEQAREAERERDSAVDAQREAETAMRDAQDAQRAAEQLVADLQEEKTDLEAKLSMLDTRLTTLAAVYNVDVSGLEQPDIDAAILDVRMDLAPGLVMLNVGEDQSVKRGYVFDVFSGTQYKGRVRVENVDATMCSAVIVGTANGATIQRGDRASTHI